MLYLGDCIEVMKGLERESVDLIFADPPYFLSNGGLSISSGKVVSVDKGEWDKKTNYQDIQAFTNKWLSECYRLLKTTGTIWVSGTHHNIFDVEKEMKKLGFKIINIVIWHKSDPPPLIYKNKFRFSYEMIVWAKKDSKHTFNYNKMFQIENIEMEDVWTLPAVQNYEKKFGYHPTQKPECLLERIISSASKEGDLVLDPFMGSGTTCYVARKLSRLFIGIEKEENYYKISQKRLGI
jgi:site-specific DNA-methyltransferase (adenine-specific)